MILPTMTGEEMIKEYQSDMVLMENKLYATSKDYQKLLKKFPRTRFVIETYHLPVSNQDYIICNMHKGRNLQRGLMRKEFAIIPDEKQNLYVSYERNRECMSIFSTHFFKRYRERMKFDDDMSIERVIGEFLFRCTWMSAIYDDEKGHLVYANSDGICLCEYSSDNKKEYFRTFVSNNMLKMTQFAAWNKVQDDLVKMTSWMDNHKDPGSPKYFEQLNRFLETYTSDFEAQEIYAQFYEK